MTNSLSPTVPTDQNGSMEKLLWTLSWPLSVHPNNRLYFILISLAQHHTYIRLKPCYIMFLNITIVVWNAMIKSFFVRRNVAFNPRTIICPKVTPQDKSTNGSIRPVNQTTKHFHILTLEFSVLFFKFKVTLNQRC